MKKVLLALLLLSIIALIGCEPTDTSADDMDDEIMDDTVDDMDTTSEDEMMNDDMEEEIMADGKDALEAFFEKKERIEFMVAYDMQMPTVGSGTLTQYFKDETHMRLDTMMLDVETQTFIVDEEITTCTKIGSWTCTSIGEYESTTDETQEEIKGNIDDYTVKEVASRNIAGVSATCFQITDSEIEYEMCFSTEGVPLYIRSPTPEGDVVMTATSYSLSVDSSVFTDFPAQPGEMVGGVIGEDMDTCSLCEMLPEEMQEECLASC